MYEKRNQRHRQTLHSCLRCRLWMLLYSLSFPIINFKIFCFFVILFWSMNFLLHNFLVFEFFYKCTVTSSNICEQGNLYGATSLKQNYFMFYITSVYKYILLIANMVFVLLLFQFVNNNCIHLCCFLCAVHELSQINW